MDLRGPTSKGKDSRGGQGKERDKGGEVEGRRSTQPGSTFGSIITQAASVAESVMHRSCVCLSVRLSAAAQQRVGISK